MRLLPLIVLLAILGAACSSPQPGAREDGSSSTSGVQKLIVGAWLRPMTGNPDGLEGFSLRPDGRLNLVGIFSMSGVSWHIDGDSLILATNTERYPEPFESSFHIDRLDDSTLTMSAARGYFVGDFKRHEMVRVRGTVVYRERMALTPEASLTVNLREQPEGEEESHMIGHRFLANPGQVPIAFEIEVLAERIDPAKMYLVEATISDHGQPRFETAASYPVLTMDHPDSLEILVLAVRQEK